MPRLGDKAERRVQNLQMSDAPVKAATAIFLVASGLSIATSTAFFTTASSILDLTEGGAEAGGAEASGTDTSMETLEYLHV